MGISYPPFLGRNPSDGSHTTWDEWSIQTWIATQCHRSGICFSSGQEGASKGRVGGARAKASGQVKGEPDLRFYLSGGRLILIELKTTKGILSTDQIKRHKWLRSLGFHIYVIYADCPVNGWNQVRDILNNNGETLEGYYAGMVKED